MATATDTATGADDTVTVADEAAAAAAAAAGNNPVILGSASFVAGAIPLALWLVGYKDFAVAGLLSNIILVAGLGLLIAAIWAINLGAGAVATVFGLFSMFWLSFALLVLGTTHGWFVSSAVEPEAAATAGAGGTIVYLITWTAAVVILTLATLRLPLAFTALFALVALALFLVLMFNLTSDTIWATIAGYVAFGAAAIGVYVFFDAMGQATGGKAMSLGNPIQK